MKIKKYEIVQTESDDGSVNLRRVNDGFNAYELLGLCELAQLEILEFLKGNIKTDKVERQYIKEEK